VLQASAISLAVEQDKQVRSEQLLAYYLTVCGASPSRLILFRPSDCPIWKNYSGALKPQQSGSVLERSYAVFLQGDSGAVGNMPWRRVGRPSRGLYHVESGRDNEQLLAFAPIPADNTNLTQTLSDPVPVSAAITTTTCCPHSLPDLTY